MLMEFDFNDDLPSEEVVSNEIFDIKSFTGNTNGIMDDVYTILVPFLIPSVFFIGRCGDMDGVEAGRRHYNQQRPRF